MRASEHESTETIRNIVADIVDRRLSEATDQIRRDLDALDARFAPTQIHDAVLAALIKARIGSR